MWSSGTVHDSGSLDHEFEPTAANMFVSLGKILSRVFFKLFSEGVRSKILYPFMILKMHLKG